VTYVACHYWDAVYSVHFSEKIVIYMTIVAKCTQNGIIFAIFSVKLLYLDELCQ